MSSSQSSTWSRISSHSAIEKPKKRTRRTMMNETISVRMTPIEYTRVAKLRKPRKKEIARKAKKSIVNEKRTV